MLLTYSVVVIAAVMVLTCLALIVTLFYIIRVAKSVERLTETVRPHIAPISHDIALITQKSATIIESVQRQTLMVEESVDNVRAMSRNVRRFEENLLDKIAIPFVKLSHMSGAIIRGFEAVYNRLTHRDD